MTWYSNMNFWCFLFTPAHLAFVTSTSTFTWHPYSQENIYDKQVRELVDKATNIVMNYTETEAKVSKII